MEEIKTTTEANINETINQNDEDLFVEQLCELLIKQLELNNF